MQNSVWNLGKKFVVFIQNEIRGSCLFVNSLMWEAFIMSPYGVLSMAVHLC
jgi:hypothetical protein